MGGDTPERIAQWSCKYPNTVSLSGQAWMTGTWSREIWPCPRQRGWTRWSIFKDPFQPKMFYDAMLRHQKLLENSIMKFSVLWCRFHTHAENQIFAWNVWLSSQILLCSFSVRLLKIWLLFKKVYLHRRYIFLRVEKKWPHFHYVFCLWLVYKLSTLFLSPSKF